MSPDMDIARKAATLARKCGLSGSIAIRPLTGGGNNRVFVLHAGRGRYALKSYFHHPGDSRDRLGAEYGFLSFARAHGIREVPEALGRDQPNRLGLYGYLDGKSLAPEEVRIRHVEQALAFVLTLNRHRDSSRARELSPGSESFFSMTEHAKLIGNRVRRLESIRPETPVHKDALKFARDLLSPAWWESLSAYYKKAHALGLDYERTLPPEERVLSPSDFGFHNALEDANGRLSFLDFEYAGWDDPAKLACDFFCQPRIPAPQKLFPGFCQGLSALFPEPSGFLDRARLLLPLYRVKWCCILLNDFLPAGKARRDYAKGSDPDRLTEQFNKTRNYFEKHLGARSGEEDEKRTEAGK